MTGLTSIAYALTPASSRVSLRWGVVTSIDAATLTVTVAGSVTTVSGIRRLASYTPNVGDTVAMLTDGRDLFVLVALASTSRRHP